jgi:hypothetical protein
VGKKSSKQETGPSKFAAPFITQGANAVQGAYNANQPNIANISSFLQNNMGKVSSSLIDNPGLAAAGGYNSDVLSGKYLGGNPHLQSIIDSTNSDVANKVNGAIGMRGGAGGSAQAQIMARELAKNESNLRYQDYSTERGYQDKGVANAAALSGANDNNIQALLQYLTGQAQIPQAGANSYAASIGGLLGNSQLQTSTPSTGSSIMQGLGTAASIASIFSDRRLKTGIRKLGEMADGLGIYAYRYIWGGPEQRGVMADEVASLRPWALGPTVRGFATVNYGAL